MLANILAGFSALLDIQVILGMLGGVVLGYLVGIMPGLNASAGMALLLPLTYSVSPIVAIAALTTIYAAAEYGGCVTAIAINTPGEPGAIPTCYDGYQFTRRGEPAKALGISIIASTVGAYIGSMFLIGFTEPIASFALTLGPPEYAALAIFALTIVSGFLGASWITGVLSGLFGLFVATIGVDPLVGAPRLYFGMEFLVNGISFVPVLIGICAISEALILLESPPGQTAQLRTMSGSLPTWREIWSLRMTYVRASLIGTAIGIIPGAGKAIASIIAYNEEKRVSRHPERFGTGVLEGVAAPEAANNAVVGGALVPLLSLGIPGSSSAAVLITAFMMHGIVPGPLLMSRHADLVYAVFAAMLVGAAIMLVFGLLMTPVWTKILRVPQAVLVPVILGLAVIGAFSDSNSLGDVLVAFIFGIIGYLMRKISFPYAPFILALVLGGMLETNVRRALVMSSGDYAIFFERPISAGLLIITALALAYPLLKRFRPQPRRRNA